MRRLLFTFIVLLVCGTVSAADVSADFKSAVESAAKEFSAAIAAKDPGRLGALYANDAIAFPPNQDMVKGKEAIQLFWKGLIDAGMTVKLEIVELEDEDDLGVEVGKFVINGPDGKTADQGKYVVVWKEENGTWKLYRDIWNSSLPAAAPPMTHP